MLPLQVAVALLSLRVPVLLRLGGLEVGLGRPTCGRVRPGPGLLGDSLVALAEGIHRVLHGALLLLRHLCDGLVALLLLCRLGLRAQPGLGLLQGREGVLVRGSRRAVGEPQAERARNCHLIWERENLDETPT